MKTTRTHWLIGLLALQPMLLQAQQESAPQPLALSLRDAVRMALAPKGNLAIDVAAESVMYAEAQLSQARTANRPDIEFSFVGQNQLISLDAQGLQSVHLPGFTFPQTAGPYSILDARFRVRQSFLDFASNRRTDVARAGIETAKTETDQVREQIAARVARLYLAAKRAATAVDTARSLVATAESALKEVTDRSGADKALPIDVAHARVQVGTQKQHLMQAELERDRAAMELLSAVNRDLNTPTPPNRRLRPCSRWRRR
jgi:outer membrane protein TolC